MTDWADEIADAILEKSWGAMSEGDWRHNHEKAISAALRKARNDALEEAANACEVKAMQQADERDARDEGTEDWQIYNQGAFIAADLAEQLLALKDKP